MPALKPKPMKEGEALREISALPSWMQPAFAGMKSLNRVQSRVADTALFTGENMLICAPTGGWVQARRLLYMCYIPAVSCMRHNLLHSNDALPVVMAGSAKSTMMNLQYLLG